MKKRLNTTVVVLLVLLTVGTIVGVAVSGLQEKSDSRLRLIVPDSWELPVGKSRTVDYAFDEAVKERRLTWSTSSEEIATVDSYGRVTAHTPGKVKVYAETSEGIKSYATLKVVNESTKNQVNTIKVDFSGNAVELGSNLQKLVTRYAIDAVAESDEIPDEVKEAVASGNYDGMAEAVTTDGAIWSITSYGVLRVDENAENERDVEQRFMGDRYLYEQTSDVLGILADGKKGIWTITAGGVTHIEMVKISGTEKATMMVESTQENVMRHGYVDQSYLINGEWVRWESDNDGLWTSMYAAGELMRYASLKKSGASAEEIAEARSSAYISTEAVLLLSNISMRSGTTEAYVRYQPNGKGDTNPYGSDTANGRYLSHDALEKDGDGTRYIPSISPAEAFEQAYEKYIVDGEKIYLLSEDFMKPADEDSWSNPAENPDVEYEKRTYNLEGYIARTYSVASENHEYDGNIHWQFKYDEDGNLIAEGVSTKSETSKGYLLNGENLRGATVSAGGEIPERLWNDLSEAGVLGTDDITEITYKGDTSSDEVIGHVFLYKLAYDILGAEDAEIKAIIANTMDRLAQHITENGYMMVDGTGQPGTWSKYNREFFYNSSQLGGGPLTASVILSLLKVAYYTTGNERWQNEYLMAALDPSYEYARLMTQYSDQCYLYMRNLIDEELANYTGGIITSETLSKGYDLSRDSKLSELLKRLFLNYSDEEMAMLAYYTLFQLETDETLLAYYREGIDDWWESIKYSENPLWYYIYQLAYPDKTITDAYGNNILETAAWSLSRHPIDTRRYLASSDNRDDVHEFSLRSLFNMGAILCYDIEASGGILKTESIFDLLGALNTAPELVWAVAAPDERSMHKYNGASYGLTNNNSPTTMEGSTTYTLPYWLGVYHNMLIQ